MSLIRRWKFHHPPYAGLMMSHGVDVASPESWKIYYKNTSGDWQPVKNTTGYKTAKDANNRVRFEPVKTTAAKMEVILPEKYAAGLFEWSVE
jgi:hypothetical protein